MGVNTLGQACCRFCGAQFRLFTIFNRDMQGLCKAWKRRHERACCRRTPVQRRRWALRYAGKDVTESSLVVDLAHPGFAEPVEHPKVIQGDEGRGPS